MIRFSKTFLGITIGAIIFLQFFTFGVIKYSLNDPMAQRIVLLENHLNILEKTRLDTTKYLAIKELNLRIDGLALEIKSTDQKIRNDYNLFFQVAVPLTIAGLISFFYLMFHAAFKEAIRQAEIAIARKYNAEETYRVEKNILLLSKKGTSTDFFESFFRKSGFLSCKKIDYAASNKKYDDYDVVFLVNNVENNSPSYFDEKERKNIFEEIKKNGKTVFFYFGASDLSSEIREHQQCASANLKSQIYSNLMGAFKLQETL
jgi:hypothetical protein